MATGGDHDASTGPVVAIGVVGVAFGLLLGVGAIAMIASWRR